MLKEGNRNSSYKKEQQTADINEMIGSNHKNVESNLVPLCEACHLQVHHGNLEI